MRRIFYRLRRGADAGELMGALAREARAGGGRGGRAPVPPGREPPGPDDAGAPLTNAEASVLISIDNTLARRDRRTGRSLTKLQKSVVAAAHDSRDAATRLEAAQANPRWRNGGLVTETAEATDAGDVLDGEPWSTPGQPRDTRLSPWGRRARRGRGGGQDGPAFREMFDPYQPLITERALLIIEVVFVLVEFAFWYGVFSGNLDRGTPLLDPGRISDILLAIMVPLSGIVAARVIGGLAHRAICRHPGVGRKEYIGATVATVVAALAVLAIFSLVHARFDGSSQLGATQLPALAMTLIFVVVLLGDMVARVFLVSEIRAQTDRWLRYLDKLKIAATRANRRHCDAWLDLRNAVQMQLDQCERIVAAGARLISDHRSRRASPAPQLPVASGTLPRSAHHEAVGRAAHDGPMAVPSVASLELYDVSLVLGPIRVAADAIDTLLRWPPRSQGELTEYLGDVLARLYRLQKTAGTETGSLRSPGPDAPQADPSQAASTRFRPPQKPIDPPAPGVGDVNGADPVGGHEGGPHEDPWHGDPS